MTHNNPRDNNQLPLPNLNERLGGLKQEFSRIFYDYQFDTFAEASELGLLNPTQLSIKNKSDPNTVNQSDVPSQERDPTPQKGVLKSSVYSPAIFPLSDVSLTTGGINRENQKQGFQPSLFALSKNSNQNPSTFLNIRDFFQSQEYIDTYTDEGLGLMWSNEPLGPPKQKVLPKTDPLALKVKQEDLGSDYGTKTFYQEVICPFDYMGFENSSDYFRADRDFTQMYKVKREENEDTYMSYMSTRTERTQSMKPLVNEKTVSLSKAQSWAPLKRADSFQDDDDDKDDGGLDGKNRSSRGLRVLSLKVKDIVSEKKRTSYKEVAEALTDEIAQKFKGKLQGESKDEQNVKRRVYDALNVLIAADILKKEGKVVYCDDRVANIGAHRRKKMKEDKDSLEQQLVKFYRILSCYAKSELKKRRKNNIEELRELVFKCLATKNLIRRNKQKAESQKQITMRPGKENNYEGRTGDLNQSNPYMNATRIDIVKDHPDFKYKNDDMIRLPFVVLVNSTSENSMNLSMDPEKRKLLIESSNPFHILGDMDVLLKMNLHHVSFDFFRETIPKEIDRYLSKADMEIILK